MVTMSAEEADRLRVLEQVLCGGCSRKQAAQLLGLSDRQLRRIVKRYKASGAAGLVHRLRGKHSNRRLDTALVLQAQQLIGAHYRDFGPTLACETLAERHGIVLSVESVRTLMRQAGLWCAKRKRCAPIHPMRERHARVGELIQIDGSEHDWFEGRSPRCTLLVFIDDATSALMTLRFVPSESTPSYAQALRAYLLRHGLPMALYSDRHSVFRNNNSDNPGTTQFARALERLGIEGIQASSPQAKGRVERANQTLQDRLVKAMRLAGIDDMHAANAWIEHYRAAHNARFAVVPREPEDAHVAWRDTPERLNLLLGHYEERTLSKTLSCQFRRQTLQIHAPDRQRRLAGQTVQLIVPLDGELIVMHDQQILPYRAVEKAAKTNPLADAEALARRAQSLRGPSHKPAANHPWKRWTGATPNPQRAHAPGV